MSEPSVMLENKVEVKPGFHGLVSVNVELTSRCNKNCWMCGRRKIDRDYPEMALDYGDMDFELVRSIAEQLPDGVVVQFHDNGEPLLYPRFGEAIRLFTRQIKCTNTNGKLLIEKADEIIDGLDTMTLSVIEDDRDSEEQYELFVKFLKMKGDRKPNVIVRSLGNVNIERYQKSGCIIATRVLHHPMGNFGYPKNPTIPEIGICLDLLSHLVVKRDGQVSVCVRLDPHGLVVIGNAKATPLVDIWNCEKRKALLKLHIEGKRHEAPLCKTCEFWGVPTG